MINPPSIIDEPPSGPVRDVAMAIIGLLPWGSSVAQLLADKIWHDPRDIMLKRFLTRLSERVVQLEEKGDVDLATVINRPETQPLLAHAFDAAAKSIGDRKLEALKNAAAQGIFERSYSFDLSLLVFSLLDRLTEGHLQILQDVQAYGDKFGGLAWPSRAHIAAVNVPIASTPTGMREPTEKVIDNGGFFDGFLLRVNNMLIDDLINMGLLELVGGRPTGVVGISPQGPTNIPFSLQFTDKGHLVYEHIFPADG